MEENSSLLGTVRNSKESLPVLKNANQTMHNTLKSLDQRSHSINVSKVADISRENFFNNVSPNVALRIQQKIELNKQKDYRESPFAPSSFKTRNLSVQPSAQQSGQQSVNRGSQSPFMQSENAKGFWSPGKEYGLLEMHRKLNFHKLKFDNGNEIDLSQSRIITQARPLKSNQKQEMLNGIFQTVNAIYRVQKKETMLSVRKITADDKNSILSESSEAHLKKLVQFAEKEKRFASQRSRDMTSKNSEVLNRSYAEIGEQIEKLQNWNIAQPVVAVAKKGKNYSMSNKAVTQKLEKRQNDFSLPSLISPSRFALGPPSIVSASKDRMLGSYKVIESRRGAESALKRTMLKPAEQIITDIQMPELSEDFELCMEEDKLQNHPLIGQDSKKSIIVVDHSSYHNEFMIEKHQEITQIIKKRQRKAALMAAFKNAEGNGKPTFMNFAAKQGHSRLKSNQPSPDKAKTHEIANSESVDESSPPKKTIKTNFLEKEDPLTREIHEKLLKLRGKRKDVPIVEPDQFREGQPDLMTHKRAEIPRIKNLAKFPIVSSNKRQVETHPVSPISGILKRGTEMEAISDVMRFDGDKVIEFERSKSPSREPKTKQVMIEEPQKNLKFDTALNDTSPSNIKSQASPSPRRKSTLVESPSKVNDNRSEARSPLYKRQKTRLSIVSKETKLPYIQKIVSLESAPAQNQSRRTSIGSNDKPSIKLQSTEDDQSSFDTERSFYSSHKSALEQQSKALGRKLTSLNLIRESMEEEEHVSENSDDAADDQAGDKSGQDKSESDFQSPAQSNYSDEVNMQLRVMRRIEKERQLHEEQEHQELCGPKLVGKVDALINKLKAGSGDDDVQNAQRLMLESGNTSFFNAQMHAHTNQDKMQRYIKIFGDGVKKDLSFFSLCKQAQNSKWSEQEQSEPKVKFYKECMRDHALALPIMTKIFDGVLIIRNFKINSGLAKAIQGQLMLKNDQVQKLYLEKNGIDGEQLSLILEGISTQHAFSNLTIQENTINEACVEPIQNLLKNRIPNNLEDLHILFCKINFTATEKLLTAIRTRSQLKRLSLVQANLNETCIKKLAEIMQSQKSIVNLDISWNQIPPSQIRPLLEVLSKNRRIQYLNLSWNNILDRQASQEDQESVLNMLGKMIKHNQNLLHLDLSGSGLGPFILEGIGNCLRKAKSLLCIHLSGNPGLTKEMQDSLTQRIKCRPKEDMERFSRINNLVSKVMKKVSTKNKNLESVKHLVDRHQDFSIYRKDPARVTDKFIIQRVLGHKSDQPGSGQWFETSNSATYHAKHSKYDCWLCHGHNFSVIFWSSKLALRLTPILTNDEIEPIRFEIDQIDIQEGEIGFADGHLGYNQLEDKTPYLAGSMTGWRYKKMIPLHEFTASLDKKPRDFFEIAYDMRKIRRKVNSADECNLIEKRWIQICRISERLRYTYQWPQFFKQGLKYKKPFLINGHMFREPLDSIGQVDDQGKLITEENMYGIERNDIQTAHTYRKIGSENYNTGQIHLTSSDSDTELEIQRQKELEARKPPPPKKRVVNEEEKKEELPDLPDVSKFDTVWVFPFFGKPGNHNYMIKYKDTDEHEQKRYLRQIRKYERRQVDAEMGNRRELSEIELEILQQARDKLAPKLFFYECNIPHRTEDVPPFAKQMKNMVVERVYDRENSVFGRWRVDNDSSLQTLVREDLKFWKAAKFVKNDDDRANCEKIILKHIVKLKEIFVNLICTGNYPTLSQLDCGGFAQKSKIIGAQVESSAVDRCFIAAKSAPEGIPMPQSNGNSLCRAQFWELILRLAQTKYKENKIFETFAESLETLITDLILQFYPIEPWQSFRDDFLWCIEVNDVLEANLGYLEHIYKSFTNQNKRWPEINDMLQLCLSISPCGVSEMDVRFCFGMCKMTIVIESTGYKEYTKLQFVEFLEFVGRLAYSKFKHSSSDMASMSLASKIEYLLDDLLTGFGFTRKEVEIAVEEFSESDDDY